MLSPFGLSEAALGDPDERIPQDVVANVWDEAQAISKDPNFGLRALGSLSAGRRGLVEYLLLNSPTVGGMIERGLKYERLWQEGRGASLERRGPLVALRWTAAAGLRFSAPLSEFAVGMVVFMARAATGRALDSARGEVRFLHPAPPNVERYESSFSAKVVFSADEQALLFDEALLALPLPKADPALLALLETQATEVLGRLPVARSFAQSVRQVLATNIARGEASLDSVAEKLHVSGRTLRRRLLDEGARYQDLVDELRRELALRYLDDPKLSVTEIGFLLGFADTAAFSKAFRRWTGRSPTEIRLGKTDSRS